MRPGTYLALVLGIAVALVGAVLALNLRVDPFGLAAPDAASRVAGVVEGVRPGAFWRKALTMSEAKPRTVILGTSRAEFGLDPRHPGFAARYQPVLNLAIGALSIEQIRLLLIHANTRSPLSMAIIGLDMESFLDSGRPDFDPAALAGNPESEPESQARLRIAVSREALAASLARLWEPPPAAPARARADAMAQREWRITDEALRSWDGQRGLIWFAEYENFHARLPLLFPQGPSASRWEADRKRAAAMASFRELLRYARSYDIELRMFISPIHARYLEWYRRVGWWALYESWKGALVEAIVTESEVTPGRDTFALWDFGGFHSISTEPVPKLGDHQTRMRWYRDTSHYSPEVGDMVLDRILGGPGLEASPLPDRRLDRAALNGNLAAIRLAAARYRQAEPEESANLDEMLMYLRRASKR